MLVNQNYLTILQDKDYSQQKTLLKLLRDRIVAETTGIGRIFGFGRYSRDRGNKNNEIQEQMMIQTDTAIEIADVVLF